MAAGKGLTAYEARTQYSLLLEYRKQLGRLGWRTPTLLHLSVTDAPTGSYINAIEEYISGLDAETAFRTMDTSDAHKWDIVEHVVAETSRHRVFRSRASIGNARLGTLPCGIDLKPSNLVFDGIGKQLYLVDTFAPQIFSSGNVVGYTPKITPFTPEMLLAVCGTREGTLLRFWRLLESQWLATSRSDSDSRRERFNNTLIQYGLPLQERQFIVDQINGGYPWLDLVYASYGVNEAQQAA
ncbi:hypothetical protein [Nocardia cerradoensis]|nr:hypothetical protein [Nocardia cerradoensis]